MILNYSNQSNVLFQFTPSLPYVFCPLTANLVYHPHRQHVLYPTLPYPTLPYPILA